MDIDDKFKLLSHGELVVTARLVDASNATLFAQASDSINEINCIYKPIAGERPLWDFPDGTLADREFAAFLVSSYLGFNIVPLTILREGPYGLGMVQEWIEIDESIDLAEYFSQDLPELRKMAVFDAIINNTDRKIGHLIPTSEGSLFGCDHGVTFHHEDKLRTVLWQWAGDKLTDNEITTLKKLVSGIETDLDLSPFLTEQEIQALLNRVHNLISTELMPTPNPDWPAIPWPAF